MKHKKRPLTLQDGVLFSMLFLLVVFGYLSVIESGNSSLGGAVTADAPGHESQLAQKEITLYVLGGIIITLLGLYLFLLKKRGSAIVAGMA